GRRTRRRLDARQTLELVPEIERQGLLGAHGYGDAWTDDARLVLRLLHAAVDAGGAALNYVCVDEILRLGGRAAGAALRDVLSGACSEVQARAIVNAAGPAADQLRAGSGVTPKLRPLRGSHLLLPNWRLPLAQAVAFFHPHDRRPIFAYPWLGAVLAGTTDLDHCEDPAVEAAISAQEAAYLIAGLRFQFPRSDLTLHDASAAFAGVRPVLLGGHAEPSRESRDHLILREQGLVTAIGGKLTTFRPLALAALRAACAETGMRANFEPRPVFSPAAQPTAPALAPAMRRRLAGRYGRWAQDVVDAARGDEFDPVGASEFLWCELRWAARAESVEHLDDLLLRRTRVGLLTPEGGARYLPRVREICASELGWDDARWQREATEYRVRWRRAYAAEHGDAV
ncbi:FAD-dependent oxidoreductase, partial [bacterium]